MEGVRGKTFERIHCEQTLFSGTGDILSKLVLKTPQEKGGLLISGYQVSVKRDLCEVKLSSLEQVLIGMMEGQCFLQLGIVFPE